MFTVVLNGILGLVAGITYNYSIQDVDAQILHSKFAFSFIGRSHSRDSSEYEDPIVGRGGINQLDPGGKGCYPTSSLWAPLERHLDPNP